VFSFHYQYNHQSLSATVVASEIAPQTFAFLLLSVFVLLLVLAQILYESSFAARVFVVLLLPFVPEELAIPFALLPKQLKNYKSII